MKRIIALLLILIFALCGCRSETEDISSAEQPVEVFNTVSGETETSTVISEVSSVSQVSSDLPSSSSVSSVVVENNSSEVVSSEVKPVPVDLKINSGVWLSCFEIDTLLKSKKGFKYEFDRVVENLVSFGIKDLYFHVRSHCDSVVNSKLFPKRETAKKVNYDILDYAIDRCHKEGIKIHGWINPYRVTATHSDINKLPQNSPAYKWLKNGSKNVVIMDGIYLNPAEPQVRQLVVDGIKELTANYPLDGIHFDDYFYPTTSPEFDKLSYEEYKKSTTKPLSLEDWRRQNVDVLISDSKKAVGSNMIFSVSPSADIDKNYNNRYADVKKWIENGYVDEIIPQIYFGFNHPKPEFNFDKLLNDWFSFCENSKVRLKIGLAAYKVGAGSSSDGDEWKTNTDILARQVSLCRANQKIGGVVFFSYETLFSDNTPNKLERENLKNRGN